MTFLFRLFGALAICALMACSTADPLGPRPGTEPEIAALATTFSRLGPNVDPGEARRAAELSYSETYRLALLYEIEDSPLTHNTKVNLGQKPRGLCYHWADDLEKRLKQERFQTLALHRAVANFDKIRIEHSTVIVSAKGQGMYDGIILDPWRKGGVLTWVQTLQDPRYEWIPREEVFRIRRERRAKKAAANPI